MTHSCSLASRYRIFAIVVGISRRRACRVAALLDACRLDTCIAADVSAVFKGAVRVELASLDDIRRWPPANTNSDRAARTAADHLRALDGRRFGETPTIAASSARYFIKYRFGGAVHCSILCYLARCSRSIATAFWTYTPVQRQSTWRECLTCDSGR